MKKIATALSVVLLSVCFVSCKKDAGTPANAADIQGTWNFISMEVSSTSTAEYTFMGTTSKTISESDYVTQNNTGTITINASSMSSNGLAYSVNTTVHATSYENGNLVDEFEMPFSFTMPSSSGSSNYRVVAADSLYFDGGSTIFSNGVTQASQPSGAKFRVEGDMLYLTQTVKQSTTQTQSGITIKSDADAFVEIKLQKQ